MVGETNEPSSIILWVDYARANSSELSENGFKRFISYILWKVADKQVSKLLISSVFSIVFLGVDLYYDLLFLVTLFGSIQVCNGILCAIWFLELNVSEAS